MGCYLAERKNSISYIRNDFSIFLPSDFSRWDRGTSVTITCYTHVVTFCDFYINHSWFRTDDSSSFCESLSFNNDSFISWISSDHWRVLNFNLEIFFFRSIRLDILSSSKWIIDTASINSTRVLCKVSCLKFTCCWDSISVVEPWIWKAIWSCFTSYCLFIF